MGRFSKFFVALSAPLGVISAALSDGEVSGAEVSAIVMSLVAAALVWVVPNASKSS
jgi:hypothetical protein